MKIKQRELFLKELKQYGIDNDIPNVSETNAHFLRDIIKIQQSKNVLEIWTASGYSTISMAIELEKNEGTLDTIEFSQVSFDLAKKNIQEVDLQDTVSQHFWNALDIIPTLNTKYDLVFIDWMKRRTKDFLELSLPHIKKNGLIIIDDVILFEHKMVGLWEFLQKEGLDYNIVPIDKEDGIMMIVK